MALDLFKKVIQRQNAKKAPKVKWFFAIESLLVECSTQYSPLKARLKCCNFALLCVFRPNRAVGSIFGLSNMERILCSICSQFVFSLQLVSSRDRSGSFYRSRYSPRVWLQSTPDENVSYNTLVLFRGLSLYSFGTPIFKALCIYMYAGMLICDTRARRIT